ASAPPRPGGTVVLADYELPQTLTPLTARTEVELRAGTLLFASLWGLGPQLQPYPDLASRVPTSDNGGVRTMHGGRSMTVDVRLVPGLRWSDGQPITADDVIFTWQALRDPALQPLAPSGVDRLQRMDRRSDTEVVWTFDGVYAGYAQLGAALPVLPAHRLRAIAPAGWTQDRFFLSPDVVSGPFAPAGGVPGDHLTLSANPHYADGRSAEGAYPDGDGPFDHAPHLEHVVLQTPPSKTAEVQALLARGVDAGFHLLPDDLTDLRGATGSAPVVTTGLRDELLNPNHGVDTATGQSPPWVDDPPVLQALDEALDRAALVRDVVAGGGRPARGLYPRALDGFASSTPQLPAGSDLEGARRLLDEAGWRPGPDAVRARGGRRLAFGLLGICGRPGIGLELDRLRRQWLPLGADVTTSCLPRESLLQRGARGAFDMAIYSNQWAPDPGAWAAVGTTGLPDNWNRCHDRTLDADLARVSRTLDPAGRREAARQAEQEWLRYRCTIPLLEWPEVRQVSTRLRNFVPDAAAPDTWNAADWWLAPA
ncbi:MAG TPA: ABC transporter substrate-binding protein, partial [Candidatus Eisenbacteria bacterium]|nr:ABC transporter substrate-binding protein [Candidatus Eisenbacteria bacterium]